MDDDKVYGGIQLSKSMDQSCYFSVCFENEFNAINRL